MTPILTKFTSWSGQPVWIDVLSIIAVVEDEHHVPNTGAKIHVAGLAGEDDGGSSWVLQDSVEEVLTRIPMGDY